jgi:hypothetical protein
MENEKLQTNAFIAPQPETQSATSSTNTNAKVEEVKAFFKDDLLKIVKSIFTEPIKGTLAIFTNAGTGAYSQALILIITTALVYTLVPYLMVGSEGRQLLGFASFFKLGLSIALVLIIISALGFGIKAISGKPDFKKELLTGALCGIPLMIFIIVLALFTMFKGNSIRDFNPQSLLDQGILLGVITLYIMLMLFNIVQQSFKASGTNDALSWYLSPLVISAAFYIGTKIAMSIFGPSYSNSPF